jgi:RNA polymerase sigma-70 factor (ECF subfamily)
METEMELDEDLVAATARGDAAAFERLYGRFERRVFGYIRVFVRDRMTAEEILVDSMTAVWFGARDFRSGSRVSTWILGIARHKALDAARRRSTRERIESRIEVGESAIPGSFAFDAISESQRTTAVLAAMARLSVEHQEALRLAFFEELPYQDIALLLGVPANTVKTRVFHAKRHLRHVLESVPEELRA